MGTKSMEILKITKNCIVPKENINLITDYKSCEREEGKRIMF